MAQARGALHVTTGGTAALLAASSWTVLGAVTLPALVTVGDSLADFDAPVAGRLRYRGAETRTFGVRAALTVSGPGAVPVSFGFRLAKNGTTIEASEQSRSLWVFLGWQGVTVEALVTLAPNDYVEVFAAVSADASLTVAELSLVAIAAELSASDPVSGAASGSDWRALEDLLNRALVASPLAEVVTYTPTGEGGTDVRGIFSLNEMVVEAGEVRIATHSPHVGLRVADLPMYPETLFGVRAGGIDYRVRDGGVIPYGGGSWVELLLEEL
jgi:hypothetical protein